MRRSVRNGLAIAGMAGGMWFLGQAVAQADQVNNVDQENTQSATSEDGGGTTGNVGGNSNSSSNYAEISVSTSVSGGDGGTNTSNVNTGIQGSAVVVGSGGSNGGGGVLVPIQSSEAPPSENHDSGDATGVIEIETHSVYVEQNANGGSVSGSGNIAHLPEIPDQVNNVQQSNTQTAHSEDDHHWWGPRDKGDWEEYDSRGMGGWNDGLTGNLGGNSNESSNELYYDVSTYVTGGDGGDNFSNVNTGVQLALLACEAEYGDADCHVNIETGSVEVIQNANGGDVTNSGNIGWGGHHGQHPAKHTPGHGHHDHECPAPEVSPAAHKPAAKPASYSAPMSSAQPSGTLAYTGSTVALPLILGLMALGLGGALTLAGRRRGTTTV